MRSVLPNTLPLNCRSKATTRSLLPPGASWGLVALFLIGGLGPNIVLASAAMIVLLLGIMLLWRPGESPVLFFAFAFPWVQASISIFHANWLGVRVADMASFSGDIQTAILLSLAGLLMVAVGMRLGARAWRWQDALAISAQARAHSMERWLRLYITASAVSFAALTFAWVVPGLSQPMLALATLRWAFYFTLAYKGFTGAPRGRTFILLAFFFELTQSVGGYFSDFRTVFFVTMFAALASGTRLSSRALVGISILGAFVLTFGIVWTTIKEEFRTFISGGASAQIVTVDYLERFSKLTELVGNLDAEKLLSGADHFLRRLTYVEYFGAVLEYVPSVVPHAGGALFWDAVWRPFMPRLLFSDKEVIDDTARTNLYTGGLAGTSEATSISLGYVAESYIDFGVIGMFPALMMVGMLFGSIYRGLLCWKASRGLLGMALATAVLSGAVPLESSFTKTFGGVIVSLLVACLLAKLVVPRWAQWLQAAPSGRDGARSKASIR